MNVSEIFGDSNIQHKEVIAHKSERSIYDFVNPEQLKNFGETISARVDEKNIQTQQDTLAEFNRVKTASQFYPEAIRIAQEKTAVDTKLYRFFGEMDSLAEYTKEQIRTASTTH